MSRYKVVMTCLGQVVHQDGEYISPVMAVSELNRMEARIAELEVRDRLITNFIEGYQEENASLRFKLQNKK